MTLRNRVAAFVLTLLFVFVMLFSQFFIIAEAEHDCIGEYCPVCEQIAVCENALKTLSNGVAAIIALLTWALLKNKLNISRKSIPIIRCLSRICVQVIS